MRMRLVQLVPFCALVAGGCVVTPYQRVAGPVTPGSAAGFSALVPTSTTPSSCEVRPSALGGDGGRAITLVYERPAEQRITVFVDYEGEPVLYTDAAATSRHQMTKSEREPQLSCTSRRDLRSPATGPNPNSPWCSKFRSPRRPHLTISAILRGCWSRCFANVAEP
jgi:hypothetical protein